MRLKLATFLKDVYTFNTSIVQSLKTDPDPQVSENLLNMYLDEYEETPWDALKYLIAGVNYGGHVTDDLDRRLLHTYINDFFNENVLNVPFYKLSSLNDTYYVPKDGEWSSKPPN